MSSKGIPRLPLQTTNRPIAVINHWRNEGDLNLNAPYQRGDVWGPIRQRNLIRSILMGVPIPSVIVNIREWGDDYCVAAIDGKQRMTAVLSFVDSNLEVPAWWFGLDGENVLYKDIGVINQRRFNHQTIGFSEGHLTSISREKEVFELVNFGGVPQGETDLPDAEIINGESES